MKLAIPIALFLICSTCSAEELLLARERRQSGGLSLYKDSDPVLQLNGYNFDREVLGQSSTAHLVEFYSFWCGHCRNFAPTYTQLAWDVQAWSDLVRIVAVSCDQPENSNLCLANGVQVFPTVKYFPRGARSYGQGQQMRLPENVPAIRRLLLNQLSNGLSYQPEFRSLGLVQSELDAWRSIPNNIQFLAIIFEPSVHASVGNEIVLDLWKQRRWIGLRKASADSPMASSLGIRNLPAIAVYRRGSSEPMIYQFGGRRELVNHVMRLNGQSFPETVYYTTPKPRVFITTPSIQQLKPKFFVSESDLLKGIRHALYKESTYRNGSISGSDFQSLKDFVRILRKYWPTTALTQRTRRLLNMPTNVHLEKSRRAKLVFQDLEQYLASRSDKSITPDDWKLEIDRSEKQFGYPFLKDEQYEHCQGSEPKYRGYTCGLWMAFHVLTVNYYLLNENPEDPMEVPRAIAEWVKKFVGCKHCVDDFVNITTNLLPMDRCIRYPTDAVMYYWHYHNLVNQALQKNPEREDPTFPKFQFPPPFLCRGCGVPTMRQELRSSPCGSTEGWDLNAVYQFILQYYTVIRPYDDPQLRRRRLHR